MTLTEEEETVLKYPPKHSVLDDLSDAVFPAECEESNAKLRYDGMGVEEANKEEGNKTNMEDRRDTYEDERIKKALTESEAESRRIYDPKL